MISGRFKVEIPAYELGLESYKGTYSGREGMPSLSPPHHLEKEQEITYTMHYLLLPSLTINVK
jgi:hypothetical protein